MQIRPYRPQDAAALDRICILTGRHGGDASASYGDPTLLCDIFLRPYLALEPELAFVLEGEDAAPQGYIVATADTSAYAARCETLWWPAVRQRRPLSADTDESMEAALLRVVHSGYAIEGLDFLDSHPAHLHIDLLPDAQGHGWGRRLMERLFTALRQRAVPGLHLGVSAHNPRAIAFYERLGFETLQETPWGRWMGVVLC